MHQHHHCERAQENEKSSWAASAPVSPVCVSLSLCVCVCVRACVRVAIAMSRYGGCQRTIAGLVLLAAVSESQTPCVDPATGRNLDSILEALGEEGLGLDTPYGRMVLRPCRAMTSQPNVACPANALCCINVNSTGWTSCGSIPRFLRYGEYLDPRAPIAQEIVGGGVCTSIPPKNLQVGRSTGSSENCQIADIQSGLSVQADSRQPGCDHGRPNWRCVD